MNRDQAETGGVRPLLVGPANCQQLTGLPWRHVRDHYRHLAVSVGRKLVVPADALLDELRRKPGEPANEAEAQNDPAAVVRARLGLRLRGA